MTKKLFLLGGIVLAFSLTLDQIISSVTQWYYLSATVYEGYTYKLQSREVILLIFAIISVISLIGSLVYYVKDFKTNKHWETTFILAVIGAATIVLPSVITNAIWLNESVKGYANTEGESALIFMFIGQLIIPIGVTTLMTLAYIHANKIGNQY